MGGRGDSPPPHSTIVLKLRRHLPPRVHLTAAWRLGSIPYFAVVTSRLRVAIATSLPKRKRFWLVVSEVQNWTGSRPSCAACFQRGASPQSFMRDRTVFGVSLFLQCGRKRFGAAFCDDSSMIALSGWTHRAREVSVTLHCRWSPAHHKMRLFAFIGLAH